MVRLASAFVLAAIVAGPGLADTGTGIPSFQKKLIEKRLAKQYEGSNRLQPGSDHLPKFTGAYNGEYLAMAQEAAESAAAPDLSW